MFDMCAANPIILAGHSNQSDPNCELQMADISNDVETESARDQGGNIVESPYSDSEYAPPTPSDTFSEYDEDSSAGGGDDMHGMGGGPSEVGSDAGSPRTPLVEVGSDVGDGEDVQNAGGGPGGGDVGSDAGGPLILFSNCDNGDMGPGMLERIIELVEEKAATSGQWAGALKTMGEKLLRNRTRNHRGPKLTAKLADIRASVRSLAVDGEGASIFVPISPFYAENVWSVHIDGLAQNQMSRDLPPPSSPLWDEAAASMREDIVKCNGKMPGHQYFRRALVLDQLTDDEKSELCTRDVSCLRALRAFRLVNMYQRLNQPGAEKTRNLGENINYLGALSIEVIDLAEIAVTAGGDAGGGLTPRDFSRALTALRDARDSYGPIISDRDLRSGSEAMTAAVGIAIAAIDAVTPTMYPWNRLSASEKRDALSFRTESRECRAAKLPKLSRDQVEFLVMKMCEAAAEDPANLF